MPLLQKIKKVLQNDALFVFFITSIMLSLNITPLYVFYRHTPPDRVFSMVHNNIQDFYFYQSLMQQGASGQWLTTDPFTLEPHQPSIIFAYFLWLGKLSRLLSIPFPIAYHLTRILCGVLASLFAFVLIKSLKLPYSKYMYVFFLFAGPFLHEVQTDGGPAQMAYMYWWTGIDAVRRFAYLPHHVFGSLFLIINVYALFTFVKTGKRKWIATSIICAMLLGFIHPPSLFIILIALPFACFIYFIPMVFKNIQLFHKVKNQNQLPSIPFTRQLSQNLKSLFTSQPMIPGICIYWVLGLVLMLVMVSQTNKGFPWSQYIAWEKNLQFPLDKELVGALGILLPFSVIGGLIALQSGQFSFIFIACWLFAPFAFIPFAQKLNISNIRLIQGTPYLPLSILAVVGVLGIEKIIRKKIVIWITCVIFLVFTIPTITWSMKDQIHEYWVIWSNVYLAKNLFPAFDFINSHYPSQIHTMSTFYTGNYLAAFTHTNSYMGHFGYTFNREKKEQSADDFFKNKMSTTEVKNLLSVNKITLVFQGVEEKPLAKGYLYPELLRVVYDKDGVTIYEVK